MPEPAPGPLSRAGVLLQCPPPSAERRGGVGRFAGGGVEAKEKERKTELTGRH